MFFQRPLIRAYVDETGDRGTSARASRYFAMVAVLIADEDDPALRTAISTCRTQLSVPAGKPLHWSEHVKRFPRRQYVAGRLPPYVVATFGHVRGFPHHQTLEYLEKKRANQSGWIPWNLLRGKPKFLGAGQLDGLQAADQYAGMLRAALEPDEFGGFEQHHLLAVRHQVRRVEGETWGRGFKVIALPRTMESYPWWPADGL